MLQGFSGAAPARGDELFTFIRVHSAAAHDFGKRILDLNPMVKRISVLRASR
jgi:hypothetical protein